MISIRPNHLIKFIPNINKTKATINQVTLLSHIADQDFLNHILVASSRSLPFFSSSLTLSKISILASIAIPIESISHAIEARVKTTPKLLTIDKTITIYKAKAIEAITHDNL